MNKYLLLAAAITFAYSTAPTKAFAQDKGEAVVKSYGDAISPDGAITMAELVKVMSEKDEFDTKVDAEIESSCTMKGCWTDVKLPDGDVMKVRFKDYGFFVPTKGLEGKKVVMKGTATREVVDVATLRHYAEDAGKSKEEIEKITEEETNLMFLADGVLITY